MGCRFGVLLPCHASTTIAMDSDRTCLCIDGHSNRRIDDSVADHRGHLTVSVADFEGHKAVGCQFYIGHDWRFIPPRRLRFFNE